MKGQGNIVVEDMLRDKRCQSFLSEEKCSGWGGSAKSELGANFFLFFLVSTGELNMKWLLSVWTLW